MNDIEPAKRKRPNSACMFKLPMMIDCETFENFISDYLDGYLPLQQRIKFELHLLLCRACRMYLKDYQRAMALAASEGDKVFSDLGLGTVPEDLIKAVIKAQSE